MSSSADSRAVLWLAYAGRWETTQLAGQPAMHMHEPPGAYRVPADMVNFAENRVFRVRPVREGTLAGEHFDHI